MPAATQSAGNTMMSLFTQFLIKKLKAAAEPEGEDLSPAQQEVIRKLLADNSVTLASVERGDFGAYAQQVAEEFPFDEEAAGNA